MIPISKQGRIQIELTNACPHRCSNCTRFTSHIQKPFFMDFTTFRQAVDSMKGYGGMLGIMGGEPTLHLEFDKFVRYYRDNWFPRYRHLRWGRQPIEDFGAYHATVLSDVNNRHGLWTSLGPGYYKHFELIQETFPYQCINDHQNDAVHQALLVTRMEMGIKDEEWINLRDNCWIQRLWSASITPKGAFFCEIAAALDTLYNGPGGWPIEPGWWERTPDQFGDQLNWCDYCGGALPTIHRPARENIQDVSPLHYHLLQGVNSPALAQGKVKVCDPKIKHEQPSKSCDGDWYMPETDKGSRAAHGFKCLSPKYIEGIVVCVDLAHQLKHTLAHNAKEVDHLVVVTTSYDLETQKIARGVGADLVISDRCYENGDAFNKGKMLNVGLKCLKMTDWALFFDADVFLPEGFREKIGKMILNPGCLYYTRRIDLPECRNFPNHPEDYLNWKDRDPSTNCAPWGYFQLVNFRAEALRGGKPFKFPECFCSAGTVDHWFSELWDRRKRILLPQDGGKFAAYHLFHGDLMTRWNGQRGASNGGWSYGGSTYNDARKYWPIPCQLRRIKVGTLEEEVIIYRGTDDDLKQFSPIDPTTFYEFSYRTAK